ncbi:MAG: hypothetical protein IKU83_02195, partial [Lachnospiraceae bacterium]|nr:hypothetical protein [Lachnospiraceae bacterium]
MKQMKRIFALALALVMIMGMTITTSAAGETEPVTGPYTVTIKNATGHTYTIYQIFTGDLSTKEIVENGKTKTVEVLAN